MRSPWTVTSGSPVRLMKSWNQHEVLTSLSLKSDHLKSGIVVAVFNLYFTEQWVGAPGNLPADLAWHTKALIIGATRNWCRNVLEWNMASDPA